MKDRIPCTFYNQFWEFLISRGIDFRPHWGKWCPFGNQKFPSKFVNNEIAQKYKGMNTWADYYKSQYHVKWNDWMEMREQMDPNSMFLTDYWAQMLGIDKDAPSSIVNHDGQGGGVGGNDVDSTQSDMYSVLKNRSTKKRKVHKQYRD